MSALRTLQSRAGTAAVLVGVLGASVLSTGTAYAFWTVVGSGSGTAAAASALPLAVTTPTAGQAVGLYPGASQAGSLRISNPNPFPVTVTDVAFAAASADTAHSGCVTTGVTFTSTVSSSNSVLVPAKSGSDNGTAAAPYTATMASTSENACQGATFTAQATVTGQSS